MWACVGSIVSVIDNNVQFTELVGHVQHLLTQKSQFVVIFDKFAKGYNSQWCLNLKIWRFRWSQTDDRQTVDTLRMHVG